MKTVWAVNYATPDDWECMRDNSQDDQTEDLASVTCLPQLYRTKKQALNAGEAEWKRDELSNANDPIETAEVQQRLAQLDKRDNKSNQRVVSNHEEGLVVLICARELKLPS